MKNTRSFDEYVSVSYFILMHNYKSDVFPEIFIHFFGKITANFLNVEITMMFSRNNSFFGHTVNIHQSYQKIFGKQYLRNFKVTFQNYSTNPPLKKIFEECVGFVSLLHLKNFEIRGENSQLKLQF